jgi:hypothetical protein
MNSIESKVESQKEEGMKKVFFALYFDSEEGGEAIFWKLLMKGRRRGKEKERSRESM